MKLGRWTSGILLGRWMSMIFLFQKWFAVQNGHDNPMRTCGILYVSMVLDFICQRGGVAGNRLKGIQLWNPKKHSHSCSSWQLPVVAVHAGPRHLLGIVMLFFVFRDLLFCRSGIILWLWPWHPFFLKIRKRKRLTSVKLVQMLIVVWGRGVCVYWGRGRKPYRIAEMWGQCIQRSQIHSNPSWSQLCCSFVVFLL